MAMAVIRISRLDVGDDNRILSLVDKICIREKLSYVDFVDLIVTEKAVSKLKKDYAGISLPVMLVPFLSMKQLEMAIHWELLTISYKNGDILKRLVARYGRAEALGFLLKSDSVKNLWSTFSSSFEYAEIIENEPLAILKNFKDVLESSAMLEATKVSLFSDDSRSQIISKLSEDEIGILLDKAFFFAENEEFNMRDDDFIEIANDLLRQSFVIETKIKSIKKLSAG